VRGERRGVAALCGKAVFEAADLGAEGAAGVDGAPALGGRP
jgi:hypothetical protein